MTNNEIIKALVCCSMNDCRGCLHKNNPEFCIELLAEDALNLIKQQKAEIDILIRKKEALADEVADLRMEVESLKEMIREMTEEET